MNNKICWINVGILEDEHFAKERLRRFVENWNWEIYKPNEENKDSSTPLLWPWVLERLYNGSLVKDIRNEDINSVIVKARIVISAESPAEFDQLITQRSQEKTLDVILTDVVMPGSENGLQFAARWQKSKEKPVIIVISAYEDNAVEAFNMEVADYIVKPVRADRLAQALHRALTKKATQEIRDSEWAKPIMDVINRNGEDILTVSSRNKLINILVKDIIYLKSELKYTTIKTKNKEYLSETSIKKFEDIYPTKFVKVYRGLLISWDYIEGVTHESRKTSTGEIRKGKKWFLKLKHIDEPVEVSRRLWGGISEVLNINPFVAYKKDFISITKKNIEDAKERILNYKGNDEEDSDC